MGEKAQGCFQRGGVHPECRHGDGQGTRGDGAGFIKTQGIDPGQVFRCRPVRAPAPGGGKTHEADRQRHADQKVSPSGIMPTTAPMVVLTRRGQSGAGQGELAGEQKTCPGAR